MRLAPALGSFRGNAFYRTCENRDAAQGWLAGSEIGSGRSKEMEEETWDSGMGILEKGVTKGLHCLDLVGKPLSSAKDGPLSLLCHSRHPRFSKGASRSEWRKESPGC